MRRSGPGAPRGALRLFLPALLILAALSTRPATVWAHATLVRSAPGQNAVLAVAPTQIRLWFSEPIDPTARALEVRGPDGRRIDVGRASVAQDNDSEMVGAIHAVRNGTYVVRWKVISADTHVVSDTFEFSVGAPSPVFDPGAGASAMFTATTAVLAAAGRWATLLGGALAFAPGLLWWRILSAATADLEPDRRRRAWRRSLRIAGWGAALIAAAIPVSLIAQMAALSSSWPEALGVATFAQAFDTRLGALFTVRILAALTVYLAGSILLYAGPPAAETDGRPPRWLIVQSSAGALALLSSALAGHAATTDPAALSLVLDWLHLAAMGAWVGGLVTLVAVLRITLARRDGETEAERAALRWRILARVLPRFSALAAGCVVVLGATGLYSALRNVGAPDQLLTTTYGRALLIKLGLLVVVLAGAGINLLALGPAVARTARGERPRASDLWPLLLPLLRVEAALLAAILGAAGVLTSVAPARQEAARVGSVPPAVTVASVVAGGPHIVFAGHARFTLITAAIAPSAGPSQLAVGMVDSENAGVAGTVRVAVYPPVGSALAIVRAPLAAQAARGQFAGTLDLASRGIWRIELDAIPRGGPAVHLTYTMELPLRSGTALLRRADRAMDRLHAAVMDQLVTAGQPGVPFSWQFQAPDREHFVSPHNIESWRIGRTQINRLPTGHTDRGEVAPEQAFRWPDYTYAQQGTDAVIAGHARVDGRPCVVVSYYLPYPNFAATLWIDERSGLIRRVDTLTPGAFEYNHYRLFDRAPAIVAP